MADDDTVLSELQLELMRVLWRRGQASTAEVAEVLAQSRGLAHTTIATLLSRLEKRGVVESHRDGRQLVYRPLVEEGAVRRSMVSGLLGSLFGGDARALVTHLLREDEIAPGDLEQLRQLLSNKDSRHD
ncbi:MAG: BlaI/MecI/CopY family transcriptional regulator [Lysobacterales bacterium]|nr:BlaI/MecI/CopY family transcriptional regulator [Rhodanobacteraceae bacterium]